MAGRPREGAWIEIIGVIDSDFRGEVAPVRGRGLKSKSRCKNQRLFSRPREGAWIEM